MLQQLADLFMHLAQTLATCTFDKLSCTKLLESRPSTNGEDVDKDVAYFVQWALQPSSDTSKIGRLTDLATYLSQEDWFEQDGLRGQAAKFWFLAEECSYPLSTLTDLVTELTAGMSQLECQQHLEKWTISNLLPDAFAEMSTDIKGLLRPSLDRLLEE